MSILSIIANGLSQKLQSKIFSWVPDKTLGFFPNPAFFFSNFLSGTTCSEFSITRRPFLLPGSSYRVSATSKLTNRINSNGLMAANCSFSGSKPERFSDLK
jgi:hypothetical protein